MKHVALAPLALAFALPASAASAKRLPAGSPPRPGSPAAEACRAVGVPLFEIRHRSEIKAPTSTVSVYPTGAWTYRPVAEDGTLGAMTNGCLAKNELATIRTAIKDAPWTITHQKIRCFAYSPSYTDYLVRGKLKFHAQMCNGDVLDEASLTSIATIEGLLPKHG